MENKMGEMVTGPSHPPGAHQLRLPHRFFQTQRKQSLQSLKIASRTKGGGRSHFLSCFCSFQRTVKELLLEPCPHANER